MELIGRQDYLYSILRVAFLYLFTVQLHNDFYSILRVYELDSHVDIAHLLDNALNLEKCDIIVWLYVKIMLF